MQGHQSYQPQLFFYADIGSYIPANHFLRKIAQVLDLSFIREMTASYYKDNQGRPSIDPEVFFKMLIIGYLFGIRSDRRLCEEIGYNLAYRWFCGLSLEDKVPDHSSLTRIRDRLGEEVFCALFTQVLELCKAYGLVKGEEIIADSTLIDANASLNSLVAHEPEQARKEIKELCNRTPLDPMPNRKISNETHTSETDPDASLAHKKGTPRRLKYKVHNSIVGDSRIILDTHVTTGKTHDNQSFLDRLSFLKNARNYPISQVIADRAYGSLEIVLSLKEQGLKTYIPLFSSRSGSRNEGLEDFIYDSNADQFICPEGAILRTNGKHYDNVKYYTSQSSDCRICSKQSLCKATKRMKDSRYLRRNIHQEYFKKVMQDMSEPLFAEKMRERRWKVEGIFAEAKNNHGLSRAKYRGRKKVQIQAFMTATIQNIKRLLKLIKGGLKGFPRFMEKPLKGMMGNLLNFLLLMLKGVFSPSKKQPLIPNRVF